MSRFQSKFFGASAVLSALTLVVGAGAVEPIPQGTFAVSVERLVSSNLHFNPGGVDWVNQLLGAPGLVPFDTPRLGLDYFIIDGLSLGAHIGTGLYVPNNNDVYGWFAILPRVGYAFSLSQTIDFWPRVGAGLIAGNAVGNDTGVITLEAMFLANITKNFAIEFGPATDLPLSAGWPDAILGANAGLVMTF